MKGGFPFVRQRDTTECGAACLAMIFKFHGFGGLRSAFREATYVGQRGTNLYNLATIAEHFGFETSAYRTQLVSFEKSVLPCIAHYDGNHFVVIYKVSSKYVWIADPSIGKLKLTKKEFESKWNGVILTFKVTTGIKAKEILATSELIKKKEKGVFKKFYVLPIKQFYRVIAGITLASFVLQSLGLALPFFTQGIFDKALPNKDGDLLFAFLLGMLGIFVVQAILTLVRNITLARFGIQFELRFFSNFFHHLLHLKQSYFDSHKREDFISRFQENIKIRELFSANILQSLFDLVFVPNFVIVMFLYNVSLASTGLIFIIISMVITVVFTPKLRFLEQNIVLENAKSMGAFLDTLLGIQTVKQLNIEEYKFSEWKKKYTNSLDKLSSAAQTHIALESSLKIIYLLSQIAIYWYGAFMVLDGQLTIGQYIAFVTIFGVTIYSLERVSSLWFFITTTSVTYDRLNDVLIQEPEKKPGFADYSPVDKPCIEVSNLCFDYAGDGEKPTLRDISLKIEFGERIGIVGRNGSGKTTLVKLLSGLYTNYSGNILYNNAEIREIHPKCLHQKVAVVPQETFIFAGSIKDNILVACPDASMDQVRESARLADFSDFIEGLYLGYDYKVGQNGGNLSVGQRRKLAFCRLLVADPDVVILDEASSALDIETEKKIMDNVMRRFQGKTIISVAHRLHTIKSSDKIVVLDNGAIAEQGTHQTLLADRGLYYQFIKTYVDM